MNERLLQYIWQHQLFDKSTLITTRLEKLQIIHPGKWNYNQGPDFSEAAIRIGNTRWIGNIELHVLSSHWLDHKHDQDKAYNNVVLHVVWKEDKDLGNRFPTLVLQDRVPKSLLVKYDQISKTDQFIPCANMFRSVDGFIVRKTMERAYVSRLQERSQEIANLLTEAGGSWEEVTWWLLAKQFGQPVNSHAFFELAKTISWNCIARHRHNQIQVEALLFGQAGMIHLKTSDPYLKMLQQEFRFLRRKLHLSAPHFPFHFLRMRPANFPSVRLAQLCALILREKTLFDKMIAVENKKQAYGFFETEISAYWLQHYRPGDQAAYHRKNLGRAFCNLLLINLVVPLKFCRATFLKDEQAKTRALEILFDLPAEDNKITRNFKMLGMDILSAADSQALLELKQKKCDQLLCLQCGIGHAILKTHQDSHS
jgi:hypothetical protein